ncbi:LysR family transcriptional regulator [Hahella aquimaris]|uniref:LysR family transcriptional regulator n=1 Tax=Hahella sp. HNIBRBA332 TaxID=3015983 RepID=UPI00273BDF1E|nr:LysR family transcriptional regulator [Hahella sp. HNIBRBA332]WLQ15130.1 LysR family transcriptional regulator [Hahella sp. HNIBRBA332]
MTLKELAYIVAVAEELHFHRAAERCHVTQSTLSIQLKKCEDYLGVQIFRRNRHLVEITPEGKEIVRLAQKALAAAEQIRSLSRDLRATR